MKLFKDLFSDILNGGIMDLALNGDATSQYYLGIYYATPRCEEYDLKKAFHWFLKSAEADRNEYSDYYIWNDEVFGTCPYKHISGNSEMPVNSEEGDDPVLCI